MTKYGQPSDQVPDKVLRAMPCNGLLRIGTLRVAKTWRPIATTCQTLYHPAVPRESVEAVPGVKMFRTLLGDFEVRIITLFVIFLLGFVLEQLIPADRRVDVPGIILNWMVGLLTVAGEVICGALVASMFVKFSWTGIFSFFAITSARSALRTFAVAFTWLAMRDFFYYWFHRLQHASKWLWAEHALHHSEESLNITTSVRHHWLDVPLNIIFVVTPLCYLFRPPVLAVPVFITAIAMAGFCIHLNARISLGRLGWLIASPQNHRIHHSRLPEHVDKNFAQFFPLWDVVFGTYHGGRPGEYPPTGLASGEKVTTLRSSLLLPFVKWRAMLSGKDA